MTRGRETRGRETRKRVSRIRVAATLATTLAATLAATALAGCSSAPQGTHAAASARPDQAAATSDLASATPVPPVRCPSTGVVAVSNVEQLGQALSNAAPGQTISLAPGRYVGNFVAHASGTPTAPVFLCGPRDAVLDGSGTGSNYVLHLDRASWWRLVGFSVTDGQKGVVLDGASNDILDALSVSRIGDEAIHLRAFSSDDSVIDCVIRQTGLHTAKFGEGIYVGSAHSHWCTFSGCGPDRSDRDVLQGNDIAGTTAENIDIKEGTTGGVIRGNHLDGGALVAEAATAWVNVKGNDWTVVGNVGSTSLRDGFQVHQVVDGWGLDNTFRSNQAAVDGPGYGIYVQSARLGTVVACDNTATGAGSGLSNIACGEASP